jgi:DNA polymerase III subunit epsilon
MQFAAIDVETANANLASICQVGVAIFRDGKHVDSWSTLVDPEDEFDGFNVAVHGIDDRRVRGAPTWPQTTETLRALLTGSVVACHSAFDRTATGKACSRYRLDYFDCRWLDTVRVARRAWPEQFGLKGYGLDKVATFLGITFKHHDALEDARAAGEILCRACSDSGLSLEEWFGRVNTPINPCQSAPLARTGNSEGPLAGHVVVFTGSLTIPRSEAADWAARAGCDVADGVTKKTTLLVVGDQDVSKLGGKAKSSKHLKAEGLMAKGASIRVLRESDFQSLIVGSTG